MNQGLDSLLGALQALPAPLPVFIRDDDAGWADDRLFALLDVVAEAGVPIDLAAIPTAVGDPLAAELRRRLDATPDRLGVHQHGHAHANHQAQGRSCEFGSDRSADAQASDLRDGQQRLQQQFGHRLDPIFTPPWNRCAPVTPGLLADLGFQALSRDRGATPQQALPELPVDVDWCRHHREGGPAAVAQALCAALQARGRDGAALGLMLHHAAMSDDEFRILGHWLGALNTHPGLRWHPMRALLPTLRGPALAAA